MSQTFTFTEKDSVLTTNFFPPLDVSSGGFALGLVDPHTFHSIPNIDESNNKLYFGENGEHVIIIPIGSYSVKDIYNYIHLYLKSHHASDVDFFMEANNNTMQVKIYCTEDIDFTKPESVETLLGFPDM